MKGRKLSPERRAANAVHLRSLALTRHKSVVCLTDGKFFQSIKSAAEFYGLTHGNIRSVTSGLQARTGGLSFAMSSVPLSRADCDKKIGSLMEKRSQGIKRAEESRRRPVLCTTDGLQYPYALAAAQFYGVTESNVKALCYAGGVSKQGLSFTFAGCAPILKKGKTKEGAAAQEAARQRGVLKNSKRVICLDDNVVYESISDAARAIGRCVESVSASIRRNGRTGGKAFRFVE